ncbi:MAG: hypothetical protein LWW87_01860 [Geobacteraceae bacterium]|nr:hypothetical protein [Geobacteraceae bacterium]
MSAEDYYCPLCGNKPYKSFVPCRLLSSPICNDCNDTIREYFMRNEAGAELPAIIQNLCDYSGLPFEEAKEIWLKEQIITSLLELRDFINYCDESGDIWENWALDELLRQAAIVGDIDGYSGFRNNNGGIGHGC